MTSWLDVNTTWLTKKKSKVDKSVQNMTDKLFVI